MSTPTSPDWNDPERFLPAEGEEVDAMDSGGHTQRLRYESNLWWFPDRSMYVYYIPKFWKAIK